MSKNFNFGFTLIELLVVISIIGILTTLVAANLNSARSRARDAERKGDVKNILTALRLYFNDYGSYPRSDSSGNILGCGASGDVLCSWGSGWNNGGSTTYMSVLPKDPLPSQSYFYKQTSSDTFSVSACLENKSDTVGISNNVNMTCQTGWIFQLSQ